MKCYGPPLTPRTRVGVFCTRKPIKRCPMGSQTRKGFVLWARTAEVRCHPRLNVKQRVLTPPMPPSLPCRLCAAVEIMNSPNGLWPFLDLLKARTPGFIEEYTDQYAHATVEEEEPAPVAEGGIEEGLDAKPQEVKEEDPDKDCDHNVLRVRSPPCCLRGPGEYTHVTVLPIGIPDAS